MIGRDWYVGMRVVCVNDSWGSVTMGGFELPTRVPMMNEVLTIVGLEWGLSGVKDDPRSWDVEGVFLTFDGITLRQSNNGFSCNIKWAAWHFRPLEERKSDISVFTSMLTGAKEREPA